MQKKNSYGNIKIRKNLINAKGVSFIMTIKTDSKKLETERIKKGMSISALSMASGLSVSSIWKIENEFSRPSPSSAKKICNALGVEFDTIFEIVEKEA